jgi:hypothetical protein
MRQSVDQGLILVSACQHNIFLIVCVFLRNSTTASRTDWAYAGVNEMKVISLCWRSLRLVLLYQRSSWRTNRSSAVFSIILMSLAQRLPHQLTETLSWVSWLAHTDVVPWWVILHLNKLYACGYTLLLHHRGCAEHATQGPGAFCSCLIARVILWRQVSSVALIVGCEVNTVNIVHRVVVYFIVDATNASLLLWHSSYQSMPT